MKKEYLKFHNHNTSFSEEFFTDCLRQYSEDKNIKVIKAETQRSLADDITVQEIHKAENEKHPLGVKKYDLELLKDGKTESLAILVKSKIPDTDYIAALTKIYQQCGLPLAKNKIETALKNLAFAVKSDIRPIEIFKLQKVYPVLLKYMPILYGYCSIPEENIYVMISSFAENAKFATSPSDDSLWDEITIPLVIAGCSEIHAIWYDNVANLTKQPWIGHILNPQIMKQQQYYWRSLADYSKKYLNEFITEAELSEHYQLIETVASWWQEIEKMPKTLIYNDLTLKNIALKNEKDKKSILLFDWDLATIHLPQRDICEFLSYALPLDFKEQQFLDYVELQWKQLTAYSKREIAGAEWLRGYLYSLYDYLIDRLGLILAVQEFEPRNIKKLYRNTRQMIEICRKKLKLSA